MQFRVSVLVLVTQVYLWPFFQIIVALAQELLFYLSYLPILYLLFSMKHLLKHKKRIPRGLFLSWRENTR